jgi:RNA polymerase sigma-70 factor (ECF subfamily)
MQEISEPELVRRARAGDKTAYEDLMRPLIGLAARLAFAMLHDRAEAEDVVQEAALNAWRRLGNLRPGSAFRPWFLAIVANQSRKARSRRWWSVLKQADLQGTAMRNPDPGLATDVRRALLVLSPDQRIALIMHFYLDLPLNEVAEALGLKESGVKSRINRALKRLRPLLAEAVTP